MNDNKISKHSTPLPAGEGHEGASFSDLAQLYKSELLRSPTRITLYKQNIRVHLVINAVPQQFHFLYAKIRNDPMSGKDESNFRYEHAMYPRLAAAGFTHAKTVFGLFHTRGAHPPLAFDRDGNSLGTRSFGREALPDLVRNPLYNLARLMDAMREKGVYDKSLIVVTADHGVSIAPHAPGHHPSESAILWVKPEGASGPLVYNGTPTGHSRVAAFMKSAAASRPSVAEIEAALREENRLFRYPDAHDRYHDIVVGPNGEIVSKKDF